MNKEKNFASAVVYVHNCEKKINEFITTIIQILEENFEHSEVICVNDSSADNSLRIIKKISELATSVSVSVINMSCYHGIEAAMNAGVDLSIGDFVFEFDNMNLDFNKDVVMQVYRRALQGYDIVSAVPDRKQKLSSKLFYTMFDRNSSLGCAMNTESFRVLSRRAINRISAMNVMIPYRKVVHVNCGLQTDNIKYSVYATEKYKVDKQEKAYRFELAVDSLILFTNIGYRFAKFMSGMMIIITLITLFYTVFAYIVSSPVEGWTSTILFLSIVFLGVFVMFTVIVKYLQIILELVFKKKHYTFESIEKITK